MKVWFTLFSFLFFYGAHAQFNGDVRLIKDINPDTDSEPYNKNVNDYYHQSFAVLNGFAYFSANDGINGRELWRSDGTTAGTSLVKDVYPGSLSSFPQLITASKEKLFFTVDAEGRELWVSNGTNEGTFVLLAFTSSSNQSIVNICAGENYTYFVVKTGYASFNQLWKTDGTVGGTMMVVDFINFNTGNAEISGLTEVNGILFFKATTSLYGSEIWRSDGTTTGTHIVKDINTISFSGDAPEKLTRYNNRLYFSANDGTGRKIWMADSLGTTAIRAPKLGTVIVETEGDYYYPTPGNNPFIISNSALYMQASTSLAGKELFRYDTVTGLKLVKDISPGTQNSYLEMKTGIADVNGTLYFRTYNPSDGSETLWKSKGKPSNTTIVKTFPPHESINNLFNGNGILFFSHYDSLYGEELWKSDGTGATTNIISDINAGANSSNPTLLTALNNRVIFSAYVSKNGVELWKTDGTTTKTGIVKNINPVSSSSSNPADNTNDYGTLPGNKIVFSAYNRLTGFELYTSDGTSAGTNLLSDLLPGNESSLPGNFISKNNYAYFTASAAGGPHGIYKTDGTAAGTVVMALINLYYTPPFYTVTDNGTVFYVKYGFRPYIYELWRSDGTTNGTFMLSNNLQYESYPVAVGNTVYFKAGDAGGGYELWTTNGTTNGTRMVKNIEPYSLFAYNNNLYFGAYDGSSYGFWKSNGTSNGTIRLAEIMPAMTYDPSLIKKTFCISNNTLFFSAYNSVNGNELWKTNGTINGTRIVKDIVIGSGSANPYNLTDVNGTLYFTSVELNNWNGLWKSNGTASGTTILKNIDSSFSSICNTAGRLFFISDDNLWSSDGTSTGTSIVNTPGMSGLNWINYLKSSGSNLYFNGYNTTYGVELYGGSAVEMLGLSTYSEEAVISVKQEIKVSIFPNPANTITTIQLPDENKNYTLSMHDASGRILWKRFVTNADKLDINVQDLAKGIYFIQVKTGDKIETHKFIKQ